MSTQNSNNNHKETAQANYGRLARHSSIVIIQTDPDFTVTDVVGQPEQLFGVGVEQILRRKNIWDSIIDPRDRMMLRKRIRRVRRDRGELQAEVRVLHQTTGNTRWILLRALPRIDKSGKFVGWEGFGIDVTDRHEAQEALLSQNKRLHALFEVAAAVQGNSDPAFMVLHGILALVKATNSDAAYGVLTNRSKNSFELVAAHGLSPYYLDGISQVLKGPSLLRYAVEKRRPVLINDIQEDPRAATQLAKEEGLRSAMVVPLISEGDVVGALVFFKREAGKYKHVDLDLVNAAAVQIANAVKMGDSFERERQYSASLQALYKVTHELSKYRTPSEIAEHALPIMKEEFGLKRAWFGVLNEPGTHIVGKGGFGPGVKRRLQEIQIELKLRHDGIDDAIRTQRPVLVRPGQKLECSGLQRVMDQLDPGPFLIVPLISLNQVVGILVAEPNSTALFQREERVQLLGSMANEMATILMARRFESRMSEALKMRMAGLLASGVAHNFNNLLQAILGQLSLIEMQLPRGSSAFEYTKSIQEVARRGAGLVSQLLSFSAPSSGQRRPFNINTLLEGSRELFRSLIGRALELNLKLTSDSTEISGDYSQIQQVITNLLVNAKDAIGSRPNGQISVTTKRAKVLSGEIDPELAPGEYIRIDLEDNGEGMDPEQAARCFEPFFTTKNTDQGSGVGLTGSGLGLSSAYSFVKQHGGLITVHSVPGTGSVFSIYLPVNARNAAGLQVNQNVALTQSHTPGLLIVGIEQPVLAYAESIVKSLGCNFKSAFDAEEAERAMRDAGKGWHGVILDMDRSPSDGMQLAAAIAEEEAPFSLILLTANVTECRERIGKHRRIYIIEKPLSVWALDQGLKSVMGERYRRSAIENLTQDKKNGPTSSNTPQQASIDTKRLN